MALKIEILPDHRRFATHQCCPYLDLLDRSHPWDLSISPHFHLSANLWLSSDAAYSPAHKDPFSCLSLSDDCQLAEARLREGWQCVQQLAEESLCKALRLLLEYFGNASSLWALCVLKFSREEALAFSCLLGQAPSLCPLYEPSRAWQHNLLSQHCVCCAVPR